MSRFLINADDFGLSEGVNRAIAYCFDHGLITSTSLMCNMDYFEDAVKLYQKGNMNVGVHLTITAGKSLLKHQYITRDGYFIKLKEYKTLELSPEVLDEIEREWDAQIQRAYQYGIKVTHLDSHHHMHINYQQLEPIFFKLARKYQVPIRFDHTKSTLPDDLKAPDYFMMQFDELCYQDQINESIFDLLQDHDIIDLMVHPAFLDLYLLTHSSMNQERMYSLEGLKKFKALKPKTITYLEL